MKKNYVVLLVLLCVSLFFTGCVNFYNGMPKGTSEESDKIEEASEYNRGGSNEKSSDEKSNDKDESKKQESDNEESENKSVDKESTSSKSSDELEADEVFEEISKPLYMEGTLTENDTTISSILYITDKYLRIEMHDYDFEPIAVVNLEDDSAFAYCESRKVGLEYDDIGVYEFLHYQDFIDDNAEFVENMEETTVNGYDVVYGEVKYEGDIMKFYYSCEYDVPIKIELTTAEGNYSAMNVTKVEIYNKKESSLFKKPKGVMFINIENASMDVEEVIEYMH